MSSQPLPLTKIFILSLVTCFPEVNLRPWMKFVASPFLNLILLTQINAKLLGDTRLHTMGGERYSTTVSVFSVTALLKS